MLWPSFESDSGDAKMSKRKSRTQSVEDKSGTFKWMHLQAPDALVGSTERNKRMNVKEKARKNRKQSISCIAMKQRGVATYARR